MKKASPKIKINLSNPLLDKLRIMKSHSFLRLSGKTQVVTNGDSAARTRGSHSLEVMAVAEMILAEMPAEMRAIVDSTTVGNVAALHDLGHPPFGHFGAETLHEKFSEHGVLFEDNSNTLVVIEKEMPEISDLVKVSVIKYPFVYDSKKGKGLYQDQYEKYVPILNECINQQNLNKEVLRDRTYESEIMEYADDIAYLTGDLEDAVYYYNLPLTEEYIKSVMAELGIKNKNVVDYLSGTTKDNVVGRAQGLREKMIKDVSFSVKTNSFSFKGLDTPDLQRVLRHINYTKFIRAHSLRHDLDFAGKLRNYISFAIENINNEDVMEKHMISTSYFKKYKSTPKASKKERLTCLVNSMAESTDSWFASKMAESLIKEEKQKNIAHTKKEVEKK